MAPALEEDSGEASVRTTWLRQGRASRGHRAALFAAGRFFPMRATGTALCALAFEFQGGGLAAAHHRA